MPLKKKPETGKQIPAAKNQGKRATLKSLGDTVRSGA